MLHRDISVNNIMWYIRDGQLRFLPIDYDNATILPDNEAGEEYEPSSRERTGTLPYMDPELVDDAQKSMMGDSGHTPIEHFLRHDVSSLFYVCLWSAEVLFTAGLPKKQAEALKEKAKLLEMGPSLELIADYKYKLRITYLEEKGVVLPEPVKCLSTWFDGWTSLFMDTSHKLDNHRRKLRRPGRKVKAPLDLETVGGIWIEEMIDKTLNSEIPPQNWTVSQLAREFNVDIQSGNDTSDLTPQAKDEMPIPRGPNRGARRTRQKAKTIGAAKTKGKATAANGTRTRAKTKETMREPQIPAQMTETNDRRARLRPRENLRPPKRFGA